MSLPAWSLLVVLALAVAFVALRRLPPRQVLAVVVLAAAIGLAVARQLVIALPLAVFAVKLCATARG